jgi:hypothetical protein
MDVKFVKIKRNVATLAGGAAEANPTSAGFRMGDLVNLRSARKQARRRRANEKAASNRLAYGRPKTERVLQQSRSEKDNRDLDGHRIDAGEAE